MTAPEPELSELEYKHRGEQNKHASRLDVATVWAITVVSIAFILGGFGCIAWVLTS